MDRGFILHHAAMISTSTLALSDEEVAAWRRAWLLRGVLLGTLAFLPGVAVGVGATLLLFVGS